MKLKSQLIFLKNKRLSASWVTRFDQWAIMGAGWINLHLMFTAPHHMNENVIIVNLKKKTSQEWFIVSCKTIFCPWKLLFQLAPVKCTLTALLLMREKYRNDIINVWAFDWQNGAGLVAVHGYKVLMKHDSM